ncbi:transmembrane protein, putative [Medicago truncatula]|uniref:Transmembrane protein, putative n=1 Tax=Medicago truncatula TaxID=3880 RepID=A0A072UDW0_MEDTR|nr:transmembrane protein, putative [Medicago truncatula]
MSVSCSSVSTCSSVTTFSSTRSLMKWCQISMCFNLLCWIGFLEMLIALRLSQYKRKVLHFNNHHNDLNLQQFPGIKPKQQKSTNKGPHHQVPKIDT